jgi:hypothetical protein
MAMWHAVRKYYCSGNFEEHIYDEPNTADTWWNVDVSFISDERCAVLIFTPSPSFPMMIFSLTRIFPPFLA